MMKRAAHMMFGISLLFAVLFPSLHAAHHLASHFHSDHCEHHYAGNTEVSHSHAIEDCFGCDFVISTALPPQSLFLDHIPDQDYPKHSDPYYSFQYLSFTGSQLLLRGPPTVG